jgi:hypothetical protein
MEHVHRSGILNMVAPEKFIHLFKVTLPCRYILQTNMDLAYVIHTALGEVQIPAQLLVL